MRTDNRTLLATWLAMLGVQTIGSIDAKHRLPAPKQYVAISVLWGILFLAADMGQQKVAARLSLLLLLTASVVGPFGTRFIGFLNSISKRFAIAPITPSFGPEPNAPTAPNVVPSSFRPTIPA